MRLFERPKFIEEILSVQVEKILEKIPAEKFDPCGSTLARDKSYKRLLNEGYSNDVYESLKHYNQGQPADEQVKLQSLNPKNRVTQFDEFTTTVMMPEKGLTPPQVFSDMRRRLDTAGTGEGLEDFKGWNTFSYYDPAAINSRADKLPRIGDIFEVNIRGLDDGDVMMTGLVEGANESYLRYSTLTNNLPGGHGRHLLNGSREYGYTTNGDGSVTFYSRGVDQWNAGYRGISKPSNFFQERSWLSFLRSIEDRVKAKGGHVIPGKNASKTLSEDMSALPNCYKAPRSGYSSPQ